MELGEQGESSGTWGCRGSALRTRRSRNLLKGSQETMAIRSLPSNGRKSTAFDGEPPGVVRGTIPRMQIGFLKSWVLILRSGDASFQTADAQGRHSTTLAVRAKLTWMKSYCRPASRGLKTGFQNEQPRPK